MESPKIKHRLDSYNCLYLSLQESLSLSDLKSEIESIKKHYLDTKNKPTNAIFLSISQQDSALFDPLIKDGYNLHFVKNGFLCLVKKIKPKKNIPSFATHHVGVGGIVFSPDFKKVLIVKGKGKRPAVIFRDFGPVPGFLENPHRQDRARRADRGRDRARNQRGNQHRHEYRLIVRVPGHFDLSREVPSALRDERPLFHLLGSGSEHERGAPKE